MRVIFCGSGSFAVPSFQAVLAAGHDVLAVVTQPARPAGRGGKIRHTPLSEAAQAAGCRVVECVNVNDPQSVQWFAEQRPDAICVADYGQFIRAPVRQTARIDTINLHGSLLPDLRGAAPVNWAIIRGYAATGVTTFSLVDRMDAGDIYLQESTAIDPSETAADLKERMARIGAGAVCRTLDMLAGGKLVRRPQDESLVTKAPVLAKADGVIDWSAAAVAIRNRIHGTWPWPAGHAIYRRQDGHEIAVEIARATVRAADTCGKAAEAGVLDKDLCVCTGDGRLEILEIKPAGKRLMGWRDFINGQRAKPGDRFMSITGTAENQQH